MKQLLFIAPLVGGLAFLPSCNKSLSQEAAEPQTESRICELSVSATSDVQLKSTGTDETVKISENAIKTLQVFVFRDGSLDAYGKGENTSSITLTCTSGSREVYALVNAPDLSSITSQEDLKGYLFDLNCNSSGSLLMYGNQSVTLPGNKTVNISVQRMVSRIVVKKVTRDFEAAALASLAFSIKAIYVQNASGNGNINGDSNTKWYNEATGTADLPSLLYDKVTEGTIANKASYDVSHYFYTMPNKGSRATRLVVEAQLGDKTFYYPIFISTMQANCSYEFNEITIKRPGSDSPDKPVSTSDITFSVSVVDWTKNVIKEQIM